jgi:hypothetical protein
VYSLQLGESTDISGLAVVLVFFQYRYHYAMENDLLLCECLQSTRTREEYFNCMNSFITKHEIILEKCIFICTDGARAMVRSMKGAAMQIKNVAQQCTVFHGVLQRQALASKKISAYLKIVLDDTVKIISFLQSRPLQFWLFEILCEEIRSQ